MYVKHPSIDGDGQMSISLPDGTVKTLDIIEGVVDWPDNVPVHSRFVESGAPEALKKLRREQEEEQLKSLAEKLGYSVKELTKKAASAKDEA